MALRTIKPSLGRGAAVRHVPSRPCRDSSRPPRVAADLAPRPRRRDRGSGPVGSAAPPPWAHRLRGGQGHARGLLAPRLQPRHPLPPQPLPGIARRQLHPHPPTPHPHPRRHLQQLHPDRPRLGQRQPRSRQCRLHRLDQRVSRHVQQQAKLVRQECGFHASAAAAPPSGGTPRWVTTKRGFSFPWVTSALTMVRSACFQLSA